MHHYRLHHDPFSSHQQIASMLRELNRGPVLDVGSAQGMLGQLMQGSTLEIDAVEPHPEWAAEARKYYRHLEQASIEQAQLPENHYQVVVCADVLEHTMEPLAVLKRLRRCATRDAIFIISLPNVAHISVRLLLLFGYFPMMKRGLLDRTHRHFYTRETSTDLLRQAGLKVLRRSATVAPLNEIWPSMEGTLPFRAVWHMQHFVLRLFRGLFAYQWIMCATADDLAKST